MPARPYKRAGGGQWGRPPGQAIVEFALVAIILLGLFMGALDFGRGVSAFITLSQTAREGAAVARHNLATEGQIRAAVRAQAGILGTIPDANIVITCSGTCGNPRSAGDYVTVQVTYSFTPFTTVFWGGSAILLSGAARVGVE